MGAGEDTDEATFEQRIEASLALAAGSPDADVEELLDDRRLTLRWFVILFPIGFALFAWLAIGLAVANGASGLVITVVVVGLIAALFGGVRRWRVDRRRLADRQPDAVFTRRERLMLLGDIRSAGGAGTARPSPPVLTAIVHWRLSAGRAEPMMLWGFALAWIAAQTDGHEIGPWPVLGWIALAGGSLAGIVAEERSLRRCRRFLATSSAGYARVEVD